MTDEYAHILRLLGRIEGQLAGLPDLAKRVRMLEIWQAWLKGAWIALVAPWAYLARYAFGK
jgi:hypothetical protein